MSILKRTWTIFTFVARRLLSQRWFVLAALLGLVASVVLLMSIPLYADAVYHRIFRTNLLEERVDESWPRPPFSFMFNYNGGFYGAKQWEEVAAVDRYFRQAAGAALNLPQELLVRYLRTEPMRLFPAGKSLFDNIDSSLKWVDVGFMSDLESHITLLEGSFPLVADPADGSVVDVLVSESLATELGLQAGESYTLFTRDKMDTGEEIITEIPVRDLGCLAGFRPPREFLVLQSGNPGRSTACSRRNLRATDKPHSAG